MEILGIILICIILMIIMAAGLIIWIGLGKKYLFLLAFGISLLFAFGVLFNWKIIWWWISLVTDFFFAGSS